jgi:predicted nucleic acid-binding Zn ribbon protein
MTTGMPTIDLTQPHDTCVRCGKPTPLGVALCDEDNPAALKGPSTTQVHGTIVVGIGIGFLILAFVANWALGSIGPFPVEVLGAVGLADGGADIVSPSPTRAQPTSRPAGSRAASAHRRLVFRTTPIEVGGTVKVARGPPRGRDPPGRRPPLVHYSEPRRRTPMTTEHAAELALAIEAAGCRRHPTRRYERLERIVHRAPRT